MPWRHPRRARAAPTSEVPAAHATRGAEVPAGTALVVRSIDDVDSQRDSLGKIFKASLDEPVVSGERTLIPRNADVLLELTEDKQSGNITGKPSLRWM